MYVYIVYSLLSFLQFIVHTCNRFSLLLSFPPYLYFPYHISLFFLSIDGDFENRFEKLFLSGKEVLKQLVFLQRSTKLKFNKKFLFKGRKYFSDKEQYYRLPKFTRCKDSRNSIAKLECYIFHKADSLNTQTIANIDKI